MGAVATKTIKQFMKKRPNFTRLTVNYLIHESSVSLMRFVKIPHKCILPDRKKGSEVSVNFGPILHRIYLNYGT